MSLTTEQAAWTSQFTGVVVANSSGGAPGGAAACAGGASRAPKLSVPIFGGHARTRAWMRKFDEFNKLKAQGVEYNGTRLTAEEFRKECIFPVGREVRRGIDVIRKMNGESLKEAEAIEGEARAAVIKDVSASMGRLNDCGNELSGGHYEISYAAFLSGVNLAMRARAAIGAHNKQLIDDADHTVKALEITRDAGFTALAIAMPESAVLIGVAGAAVTAADDWAGGKDLKTVTYEFVLNVFLNKLARVAKPALSAAWTKGITSWLDRSLGQYIQKATSSAFAHKFESWILEKGEAETKQKYIAMLAKRGLSPAEAAPLLEHARTFIYEKHVAKLMIDRLMEQLKDTLEKIGKVTYAQIVAGNPHSDVKERCMKFLEELKKEEFKDSNEKSELLHAVFEKVANEI